MKNSETLKTTIIALMLCLQFSSGHAQVGINQTLPDSSAVLEIKSDNKGLLIPRLHPDDIVSITNPANGLLVYDSLNNIFCYYNDTNWISLPAWKQNLDFDDLVGGIQHITTSLNSVSNVGIGTFNPDSKLTVNGDINSYGKVKVYGKELLPAGSIIMWSGTTAPDGWAICDGGLYDREDGNGSIRAPNLKGKFIAGFTSDANNNNNDGGAYDWPGDLSEGGIQNGETGGASITNIILSTANLPSHTHTINHGHTIYDPGHDHSYNDRYFTGTAKRGTNTNLAADNALTDPSRTSGSNTTGVTVDDHNGNSGVGSGSSTQISRTNIPPYYVLAYIMKL
ncbi:MAG: tail fiber protein [Bacteroidales bacterium]